MSHPVPRSGLLWFCMALAMSPSVAAARGDEQRAAENDPWALVKLPRLAPGNASQDEPADAATGAAAAPDADAAKSAERAEPPPRPLARAGAAAGDRTIARSESRSDGGWMRTTAALAAVIVVILLLAWGYRTISGGARLPLRRGRQPGALEVLARSSLSPRHAICLVRVGPRLVLIGVSPDRLTALDVLADADIAARVGGEAARTRPDSHAAEFERFLEREARQYPNADDEDEAITPDEQRVHAIRRTLAAAAARLAPAGGAKS